jgi:hypothetical protein
LTSTKHVLRIVAMRDGDQCWERTFERDDTITQNEDVIQQAYVDDEFQTTWYEYMAPPPPVVGAEARAVIANRCRCLA